MSAFKTSRLQEMAIPLSDQHALKSMLMNNGISAMGAQQFVAGDYIVDPQDRKLMASLFSKLVQVPGIAASQLVRWDMVSSRENKSK